MNNDIVLFGASSLGKSSLKILQKYFTIKYFCDNDPEKWGTFFEGIEILSPEGLIALKYDGLIIITSSHHVKIKKQLNALGLSRTIGFNTDPFLLNNPLFFDSLSNPEMASLKISYEKSEFYECFEKIREPKTIDAHNFSIDNFLKQIAEYGVPIKQYIINKNNYEAYMESANYNKSYYGHMLEEKSLEHFVASELLELNSDDIYIDIATSFSPTPDIYARLFGVKAYRQDLFFPHCLNGDMIGGDASDMPVCSEFASKMALHCSFEHFEGDSDIRFIKEAARVLKPKGKLCILPLYTSDHYSILTNPIKAIKENVKFEDGVLIHCREDWYNRHGRIYDAEHFINRIYKQVDRNILELEVYKILGFDEISSKCYLTLSVLITKK